MEQLFWRSSRQFSGTRSVLRWWRNAAGRDLPPRGFVWIFHGIGEHGGRYAELAEFLTQFGVDVIAPDWPGHGLSRSEGGQRQLVSLDKICREFWDAFEDWVEIGPLAKRGLAQSPWSIVSHSMGSAIALKLILDGKRPGRELEFARRAFVSAPPLRLKLPVPAWKVALAKSLGKALPYLELKNGIDPNTLTHDAAVVAKYRKDTLVHEYASPEIFLSIQDTVAQILARPQEIEIPLCLAVGEEDQIVDPLAVRDYYGSLGTHKKFLSYPGFRHEIFNEVDRKRVYEDLIGWLF